MNATSHKIEKIEYEIGEKAEYKDISYVVKSSKILDVDQLNAEFKLNIMNSLYDIKYIVMEIEMEYTGDQASVPCELGMLNFQSVSWHNGQALDVFFQLNANSSKMEKGKKYTLYTAGNLGKIMFLESDWKKLKEMKYELVLSTYPKEIVLKCN